MIGILFLVGIFFYVALSGQVYRYVAKRTDKKLVKIITVFILIFIAVGDNILGETIFYYLCKTSSGKNVYKTVENVEGFYIENYEDGPFFLIKFLFENNYKFIEAKTTTNKQDLFTESKGYYRFNLSYPTDENCEAFNLWKSGVMEKKVNFYEEFTSREECISIKKIKNIQSKYSIMFNKREKILPFIFISRTRTEVKNIATGELMGVANWYSYSGGWVLQLLFDGVGHTKSCHSQENGSDKKNIQTEVIYDVLRPKNL